MSNEQQLKEVIEGIEKGEVCNRDGCTGIINERDIKGCCSCHINPPCSYCETDKSYCPVCGWDGEEEKRIVNKEQLNSITQEQRDRWAAENEERERQQHLFNGMWSGRIPIDKYRAQQQNHTHFSQIIIGVFPEGTETRESILEKVRGTFGGRFEIFDATRFKYIAYTD